MQLIDTSLSNTKIAKTQKEYNPFKRPFRISSLSLYPNDIICPGSLLADCQEACLRSAGYGKFKNVREGRQKKTDLWLSDPDQFLDIYTRELGNFQKLCDNHNVKAVHRPNTISDIDWENYDIPQQFPNMFFYDYTKRAHRLTRTPKNYRLMFSFSGVPGYQNQVKAALKTDAPISAVFNGPFPDEFLGREVIDGDKSDLINLFKGDKKIIGLKAKGDAKKDNTGFVIHTNTIPTKEVA
jgi:hypothetical protein